MKFKMNRQGFRELRNSPGVVADLEDRAERVANSAEMEYTPSSWETNEGFIPNVSEGRNRARGSVVTGNPHAARHAAAHNTLVRALEAGRD